MADRDSAGPVDELNMCCGGKKKCPVIREFSGGKFEISDPDADAAPVVLDGEQAALLVTWLGSKLRAR